MKTKRKFTVVIERDEEGYYVASVSCLARLLHAGQEPQYTNEARP
jgi:predicted RNase H-like HicB family nuclease